MGERGEGGGGGGGGGERGERREERGGIELHVEDQKLWWDVKIVRLS